MIVDANVAVYWSVPGPYAESARPLLHRTDLRAPNLILIEVANALLKYVRANQIGYDQLRDGVDGLRDAVSEFVSDGHLLAKATDIAFAENHKIYDCLYLALALERREPLATADKRMAGLARRLSIEVHLIEPA